MVDEKVEEKKEPEPEVNKEAEALQLKLDAMQSSVDKLEAKNQELIGEMRTDLKKKNDAEMETAKGKGDIEAINASWEEKYKLLSDELAHERKSISNLSLTNITASIAAEISKDANASIMLTPHIKARLKHDNVDGKYVTKVIDVDGKPSALTIAELTAEFKANAVFADLIAGTKANGTGGISGGTNTTKSFGEHTGAELVLLKRSDPEQYNQLRSAK